MRESDDPDKIHWRVVITAAGLTCIIVGVFVLAVHDRASTSSSVNTAAESSSRAKPAPSSPTTTTSPF